MWHVKGKWFLLSTVRNLDTKNFSHNLNTKPLLMKNALDEETSLYWQLYRYDIKAIIVIIMCEESSPCYTITFSPMSYFLPYFISPFSFHFTAIERQTFAVSVMENLIITENDYDKSFGCHTRMVFFAKDLT